MHVLPEHVLPVTVNSPFGTPCVTAIGVAAVPPAASVTVTESVELWPTTVTGKVCAAEIWLAGVLAVAVAQSRPRPITTARHKARMGTGRRKPLREEARRFVFEPGKF
jgi:hypothetical protein